MAGEAVWLSFPVQLVVEDGRGTRRLEYDGRRPCWIGSDPECDVPLSAQQVSARHACLFVEGKKLMVRDAASQHGTFLNRAKVERSEVREGDVITIGSAQVAVSPPAAQQPPDDEAEGAAKATRGKSQRPRRRAAGESVAARRNRQIVWGVLSIGGLLVAGAVAFVFRPDSGAPPAPASETPREVAAGAPAAALDAVPPPADGAGPPSPLEPPAESVVAVKRVEATPDDALADILGKAEKGELGWDVLDLLGSFLEAHPEHESRDELKRRIALLSGTKAGAEKAAAIAATRAIDKLWEDGRYGDACESARFLGRTAAGDEARARWEKKAADLEAAARARFTALEGEMNALLASGKSGDALRALVAARRQFATLPFYESLLEPRIDDALSLPLKPAERPIAPEVLSWKDRAGIAFDDCEYRKLAEIHQTLLAFDPDPPERLRLLEGLVDAQNFGRMLDDFMAFVAKSPVEVASLDGYPGRIVHADLKEYEYELDVGDRKGAARGKQPWRRLVPAAKIAVFEGVPAPSMSREGLLGLAALAFRSGDEESGQRTILRLFKRPDAQELASVVLARHLGIAVPPGGFVELEGKLVTPEAKATELARRKKAEEEDKQARAELLKAKKDMRVGTFIDQAKRLRQQGSFTLAQALLAEVSKRFPGTPAGKEAQGLLDDPILSISDLFQNGPSKNRLDFYFLGDGYPAEDGYQSAFLSTANSAMKLVLKEEPFKEYASYLNFHAVQLASKDRGLERLPGNQRKNTPVGGKVTYDVFTADRGKAMALIRRASKGAADGQAIVIGNDFAGVSTGGGGVSSVCKASLTALAHEIGHSLGGLRDEYDFEPGNDPGKKAPAKRDPGCAVGPLPPNLMRGPQRDAVLDGILWKNWIDAGPERWWNGSKVSAFEGGERQPFNVWRPQSSCKMRDSTGFCVVCMEIMVKALYRHVRPIDRVDPDHPEVLLANGEEREVRIWPMKPETHLLEVKWMLEQLPDEESPKKGPTVVVEKHAEEMHKSFGRRVDPEGRVVDFAVLRAKDLSRAKRFKLRVEVHDPTPWILQDEQGLLTQSREWIVKIAPK